MTNEEDLLRAAKTFEDYCGERHCGDCYLYPICGEWTDTSLPRMMTYFIHALEHYVRFSND